MCKCETGIYSILILKIYFKLFAADEENNKNHKINIILQKLYKLLIINVYHHQLNRNKCSTNIFKTA